MKKKVHLHEKIHPFVRLEEISCSLVSFFIFVGFLFVLPKSQNYRERGKKDKKILHLLVLSPDGHNS